MTNRLRVLYNNALQRATLSASSEAGSLVVDNLRTTIKQEVYRATGTSATLTAIFPAAEFIGCVSFPFCNYTSAASIRVRGYTNVGDASPSFDTGAVLAGQYTPLGLFDWGTQPLGVNAFSYGGAKYATIWFPIKAVKKLVIDIVDTSNPAGYVESGCLVMGSYFSPKKNFDYGASISIIELSKHERNHAGNLRTERGPRSRDMNFDLKYMDKDDRNELWNIFIGNGMTVPMLISLMPEEVGDPIGEQMFQLYGKLSQQSRLTFQSFGTFQAPVKIEEV